MLQVLQQLDVNLEPPFFIYSHKYISPVNIVACNWKAKSGAFFFFQKTNTNGQI